MAGAVFRFVAALHQVKLFAQYQQLAAERHVGELFLGDGLHQDDQDAVNRHGDGDGDQEREGAAGCHGMEGGVGCQGGGAHDEGGGQGKQEGGFDLLSVVKGLADGDPVEDTYHKGEGYVADDQTVDAPV